MPTIGTPEARARLQAGYAHGLRLPGNDGFAAVGQVEQELIKMLGPEAGRTAFRDSFATAMGATTFGNTPRANLLKAVYGNYLRTHNLPYPAAAHEMPFPIGGNHPVVNMLRHKDVFDAGGWPALGPTSPKGHNMAGNFMGHRDVAMLDQQITSGAWPPLNAPQSGKYGLYEGVLDQEAARAGVRPADFADGAYFGFRNKKSPWLLPKPMIQEINDAIERTHRLTGMPRDEIFIRAIGRREIPLYGLSGLPGLPAILPRPNTESVTINQDSNLP